MTENKIVNNRTENKASRMLHTSLLTFLPSPLLITLPPPIPLQFWRCLYSPAPWCIGTCSPAQPLPAPPQIQTLYFSTPLPLCARSLFSKPFTLVPQGQIPSQQPLPSRGFGQPWHPCQKRSSPPLTPWIPHQGLKWQTRSWSLS